jgi:hypothetical protein
MAVDEALAFEDLGDRLELEVPPRGLAPLLRLLVELLVRRPLLAIVPGAVKAARIDSMTPMRVFG